MNTAKNLIDSLHQKNAQKTDLLKSLDRSLALQALVPDAWNGGQDPKTSWTARGQDRRGRTLWPKDWTLNITKGDGTQVRWILADEMPINGARLALLERVSCEIEEHKLRPIKKDRKGVTL